MRHPRIHDDGDDDEDEHDDEDEDGDENSNAEDDGDDDVQHDEHDLVVSAGSELQTSCFAAGHFPTRSPKLMTTRVQRMLHAEQATCALIRWHLA